MKQDLHNNIKAQRGISPVAAQTNVDTAIVSQILDTANAGSVEFLGIMGANTDANATFTVLVEEGNASNLSDAAAVDDADILGVEAMGLQYDSDNQVFKIGYIGSKRYVRVTITPSGNNSGDVFLAAIWVTGHRRSNANSTQVV